MKVLWSRCTSHLLSHLGSMIKAKKLKTTFYDHFSRSSVGRQGGRQFFPGRPTHPRRKVLRNFGSEALCKASVSRLKEEGVVTLRYC